MLERIAALVFAVLVAHSASAQTINAAPPVTPPVQPTDKMFIFRGNTPVNSVDVSTLFGGQVPATTARHVATNAALAASPIAFFPQGVWRDNYAAGNAAQPLFYQPSNAPCTVNSGAGDNGSQVRSV